MTAPAAANSAENNAAAQAAWRSVRESSDIQFAPVPPDPPPVTPEWLKALGEWLDWLLKPLGNLLGGSWSMVEKLLIIGAALGAVWIAWALLWPLWLARKGRATVAAPEWTPPREEALALLEDADRLAAQGLYGEAAHLLLRRSVGQIARARPDWLTPASTAREIGAITGLPTEARSAFGTITALVERARYALRPLGAEDWSTARAAYARFALEPLGSAA
ncbi:DUF4129 domain-containing protein [Novosphingobium sp.]|uniref:DUF4129 domain-containing protein n=1 Tax=Novosphingobium sp. TaxID=1874826 RepID=UPI002618D4C8|nr:DUF4129 domain-containing protein [Novosphingobium sp.]